MTIKSINPATLELNGEVEETPLDTIEKIFERSRVAQKKWAKISVEERAKRVIKINEIISTQYDEISLLISKEVGKPPAEAYINEVYGVSDSTFYYYTSAKDILGQIEEIPLGFYESLDKKSILMYKPIGVVCVIGPYNYPFVLPIQQIVQSILAGNGVVFKPSSSTVLTAKKVQEIFDQIDLPKDLVQTVYGNGSTVGNLLIDNADKVLFTGSTETGKKIMERASKTLTRVCLELGGKSQMIVFPDADLDRAVSAARWGSFTNAGQVCTAVKLIYLHTSIYDKFLKSFVEKTKQLKQDIPTKPNVDVGAMVNEEQMNKVDDMVKIGIKEGAKVLTGGRRNPKFKGYFYEPTILTANNNNMQIVQQEIFGPVVVVLKFKDENEALEMVNDNQYGLTASVWTNDLKFGQKIAEEIDTGTVMINEVVYTFALASTPWGGTKNSGIGRSHGKLGFLELSRPLHLNIDQYKESDLWWYPYDENYKELAENFKNIATSLIVKNSTE